MHVNVYVYVCCLRQDCAGGQTDSAHRHFCASVEVNLAGVPLFLCIAVCLSVLCPHFKLR